MRKSITKGNELIALFMGVKYDVVPKYHGDWNLLMSVIERIESMKIKGLEHISTGENAEVIYLFSVSIIDFQCTIDRDILPQYYGTETDFLKLYDCRNCNKIKSAYNAIISFVKWYNKHINIQK